MRMIVLRGQSFNSRTPGGVRRSGSILSADRVAVSIHAPREGCDVGHTTGIDKFDLFQFTHPGRGATCFVSRQRGREKFQFTHPGRGATVKGVHSDTRVIGFNSRTPGGVRQYGAKLPIMGRINKRNLRLAVLL